MDLVVTSFKADNNTKTGTVSGIDGRNHEQFSRVCKV